MTCLPACAMVTSFRSAGHLEAVMVTASPADPWQAPCNRCRSWGLIAIRESLCVRCRGRSNRHHQDISSSTMPIAVRDNLPGIVNR